MSNNSNHQHRNCLTRPSPETSRTWCWGGRGGGNRATERGPRVAAPPVTRHCGGPGRSPACSDASSCLAAPLPSEHGEFCANGGFACWSAPLAGTRSSRSSRSRPLLACWWSFRRGSHHRRAPRCGQWCHSLGCRLVQFANWRAGRRATKHLRRSPIPTK